MEPVHRSDLPGHQRDAIGVAFAPDGHRLASCSADGAVKIWNLTRGKEERTLRRPDGMGRVFGVAFSPDGKLLASASDAVVMLWDPDTGSGAAVLSGTKELAFGVSFDKTGRRSVCWFCCSAIPSAPFPIG